MAYSDNFSTALISLVNDLVTAEKMTLSEMLYEQAFEQSDLATTHEVVTGVRNGHVVPILKDNPNPDSFPFVDETSCAVGECAVAHEFSSKAWELGLMECRVGICLRSFDENFLKFFSQWRQTQEGEPNLDSALIQFINGKFVQNLQIAEWRAAYFADKSSASPLYNGFNGIFVQAQADANQAITITENDELTYTAQSALTGEAVYNYLVAMYEKAAQQAWFDTSIMEYRVTKSMAQKLVTYLNNLNVKAPNNCACIDPKTAAVLPYFVINGLTLNGIPILVHNEWDTIINYSATLNGGGADNPRVDPHRALLSVRSNVLIGTSESGALQSFDIWYDKTDKKVYLEGSSYIGSSLPLAEYIVAI